MKRKGLFLFLWFSLFVFAFWLGAWTAWAEGYAHYTPKYAKVNIVPILQKEELKAADYEVLFRQTGMGQIGVDQLWGTGRQSDLLYLQERFFAEVEMVCLQDLFVVRSERLVSVTDDSEVLPESHFLPAVQTGDILISFSGHVFGWRNGHAAIVVDAEAGLTLEAITLGSTSRICKIGKWAEYPCFALLRLKGGTAEERAQIAEYAEGNLVGLSYRLPSFSGDNLVKDAKSLPEQRTAETTVTEGESLTGTHCAHLVWAAYAYYGYDLDSDGGLIVTPRDIFDSDLLEVVQIYGLAPEMIDAE